MFRTLYGYEVASSNDPLATRTQKLFSYFTYALISSNYLVNLIPALRYVPAWFPGAGWKREVLKWRKEKDSLVDELYNIGLENKKKSESAHIMVTDLLRKALELGLTKEEAAEDAKQAAITLIGGSIETTMSTLMMFILAMVLHPEVQEKAQQELDSVIGNGRLPTFEDQANLGCIERIIQELLRWYPVAAFGVPHTCFEDDTYKGYHIPKGAIVVGNVWAMTRDKTVYKNPDVFDPDRFLDPSTPPSPAFGWGRRRCPGNHLAQASLFISIASILMTFNIGLAQDKDGHEIRPSGKMVNSLVLTPEKFPLKLTPRSAKHEELIRESF
ncbi:cytochrome P450 family protein [Rhizoctonia solani 123E]|nr:cytochrome P450 family protein [Rhizoctonia solani 123E]